MITFALLENAMDSCSNTASAASLMAVRLMCPSPTPTTISLKPLSDIKIYETHNILIHSADSALVTFMLMEDDPVRLARAVWGNQIIRIRLIAEKLQKKVLINSEYVTDLIDNSTDVSSHGGGADFIQP